MDIKHLKYLRTIIENDFNISAASKILHISQPALSQMITQLEQSENVTLFERSKGRLKRLSPAGEVLYENSKEILEKYDQLLDALQEETNQLKGSVKIGIPPVVISVIFPELLPKMITENPDIKFEIIESGAAELKNRFLLQETPITVLLDPTGLDKSSVEEVVISKDCLCVYMSEDNPLASKSSIEWEDLHYQPMAIFDSNYMIHHQLMTQFQSLGIKPQIHLQSASWDLLLNATRNSNLVTVLPSPVTNHFQLDGIKEVPFSQPAEWRIVLCRRKQKYYSHIEDYVFNYIKDYFCF
jgi:DNA-binding transcriptional LysR family regulator